jgi:type IV secretory pathway VirB2 component (pilin)
MIGSAGSATVSGDGSSLVTALLWVQGVLLGTTATVVGVIAVASIGLLMLGGRVEIRQGMRTVLGLFLIFSAPTIASAIASQLSGVAATPANSPAEPPPLMPESDKGATPPEQLDPYAGASVLSQ